MPDPLPGDMGFAEFVSKLIEETFEAVTRSTAEQQSRRAELQQAASLPLTEFARRTVADDQVEALLLALFPSKRAKTRHLAVAGTPYRPATDTSPESPPFAAELGITLGETHLKQSRSSTNISPAGEAAIRSAARELIARSAYESLRATVAQGVPMVQIDHGKIHARLVFRAVTTEDAARPDVKKRIITPLKPLGDLGGPASPLARQLRTVRLVVSQADTASQPTGQTTDLLGDVEITFKTVT